mmetsp:Transcript_8232/g.17874  ORF Transcript_8232/g.17874 Transcript_8232/m.17874 type:complete len:190 (-) Transcript_8232:182-751(-)
MCNYTANKNYPVKAQQEPHPYVRISGRHDLSKTNIINHSKYAMKHGGVPNRINTKSYQEYSLISRRRNGGKTRQLQEMLTINERNETPTVSCSKRIPLPKWHIRCTEAENKLYEQTIFYERKTLQMFHRITSGQSRLKLFDTNLENKAVGTIIRNRNDIVPTDERDDEPNKINIEIQRDEEDCIFEIDL